jgi:hypothetical protein
LPDLRIVNDGQNQSGGVTAANVRGLMRANALVVVLVNASGDIVNPSVTNVDVDLGDQIRVQEQNVTGVNVVGGSIGGQISFSGDSVINTNQRGAWSVAVSGDVSTTPKSGSTWPVSFSGTTGVQIIGGSVGARISASGDINVSQQGVVGVQVIGGSGGGTVGVSGDVTVTPKTGSTWPVSIDVANIDYIASGLIGVTGDVNVRQQVPMGVQIVGGAVGGSISISGDGPLNVNQRGAWSVGISGDVNLQQSSNRIIGRVEGPLGVQVVGTSVGTFGISGDVNLQQSNDRIIGRIAGPLGVQIVGSSGSGTVGVSGDVTVTPKTGSTWPVSIDVANIDYIASGLIGVTGDVNVRQQTPIGIQILGGAIGGSVSISGDGPINVNQKGAWSVAVSGDVTLQQSSSRIIGRIEGPIGVQIVGSSGSGTVGVSGDVTLQQNSNRVLGRIESPIGTQIVGWPGTVGISGDSVVNVVQRGAWATAITGDVNVVVSIGDVITVGNVVGSQIVGGSIGGTVAISGDSTINSIQRGGWSVGVSGDILLRKNDTNTPIGTLSTPIGVQVVGGSIGSQVSFSGDTVTNVNQRGAWSTAISGDISLQQSSNRIIGRIESPVGVQIVGTSVGTFGISGDVSLQQSSNRIIGRIEGPLGVQVVGSSVATVGISGDPLVRPHGTLSVSISGDSGVTATIRDYANSNPLAVTLTNASGDVFDPLSRRNLETKSGNYTTTGSRVVAQVTAPNRLYVTAYDFQAQSDFAYVNFASGASGSALTPQWILGAREGVAKAVSPAGYGYMFRTDPGVGISLENNGNSVRWSVSYYTGDA